MALIRTFTPLLAASSGSAAYLLAGGGEFWAAVVFLAALTCGEDGPLTRDDAK